MIDNMIDDASATEFELVPESVSTSADEFASAPMPIRT